ncbi:SIR2 family protein [Nibribacter ruber]|uniref:SIR2 family protein n=1 Tax=Nibribacter ruber TaxID=2698458 RepID=A0A6P1NW98_9BACT|nr:SIR2 family protein [Nibribacter ruber]QHL87987.1 SIR2 family protein [Nibribacter ruber]
MSNDYKKIEPEKYRMQDFEILVEELKKHLDSPRQNWLLGAGISFKSNIPLMFPLTYRVEEIIENDGTEKGKEIYHTLTADLDEDCHIEHYLSHLGDLIALSERSKDKAAIICDKKFSSEELREMHRTIVAAIGQTVRFGYSKDTDALIGTPEKPIVEIAHHLDFVRALFKNRANLESRSRLSFFTTNYDTLLEDALAIERKVVIDGFSGGAVGFWNPNQEFKRVEDKQLMCGVYKLHGSIDWHCDKEHGLVRVRYGTKYLPDMSDIMIYPQATKYVETQKDPFAFLFERFRRSLNSTQDNVLVTCGYSFGDDHINSEIESALRIRGNRTTLLAFSEEAPKEGIVINRTLDRWLKDEEFGSRIYVAGKDGIYHHSTAPAKAGTSEQLLWWTFNGMTNFLATGEYEKAI